MKNPVRQGYRSSQVGQSWIYAISQRGLLMRHVTDRNEPALDEATRYGFFVDHNLVDPDGGSYIDVINPATGAVWAQVPSCSAADVDRAVRSARQAFEHGEWPNFRAADRANFLI